MLRILIGLSLAMLCQAFYYGPMARRNWQQPVELTAEMDEPQFNSDIFNHMFQEGF